MTRAELAALIDHTILKPEATPDQVLQRCEEARAHRFASVCVNPVFVPLVADALRGSPVLTCSVVAFPFGAAPSAVKAAETELAVAAGAAEIDMVIQIGALKAQLYPAVRADVAAVRRASGEALLKVIIECCLLTDAEKEIACRLAQDEGADFVKTSTGFSTGGATLADVALMRRTVGPALGVKASGGIRDAATAREMIAAGATRIGTSNGLALLEGLPE
jgi:deoxyribose-phosphate aldolase